MSSSDSSSSNQTHLLSALKFVDAETKKNCMAPHIGQPNHQRCWRSPPMNKFQKGIQCLENLHGRKWREATLERKLIKAARGVLCKICWEEGQVEALAEEWMENEYVRNNLVDQPRPLEPPFVPVFGQTRSASTTIERPLPGQPTEEEALQVNDGRGRARRGAIIDETKVEGLAANGFSAQENAQAMRTPEKKTTKTRGGWKVVGLLAISVAVFALASWLDLV